MPMPIAHGFLGAAITAAVYPKVNKFYSIPLFVGGFLANLADFDFLPVLLSGDKSWHRSFSHSILFSILVFVGITFFLGKNRLRESTAYGLAYFSHIILDYSTTKIGGGLELFWFFSWERFGLRRQGLSEVPSKLSTLQILQSTGIEFLIFGSLFVLVFCMRKMLSEKTVAGKNV